MLLTPDILPIFSNNCASCFSYCLNIQLYGFFNSFTTAISTPDYYWVWRCFAPKVISGFLMLGCGTRWSLMVWGKPNFITCHPIRRFLLRFIYCQMLLFFRYEPQLMHPSSIEHAAPSLNTGCMSLLLFVKSVVGAAVGIIGLTSLLPCFSTVNWTACEAACVRK